MYDKSVHFAEFEAVLLRLGFERKPTKGQQRYYQHKEPDTWIVLPPYKSEDTVRPIHIQVARRLLSERGLVEGTAFDLLLLDDAAQSASAAQ